MENNSSMQANAASKQNVINAILGVLKYKLKDEKYGNALVESIEELNMRTDVEIVQDLMLSCISSVKKRQSSKLLKTTAKKLSLDHMQKHKFFSYMELLVKNTLIDDKMLFQKRRHTLQKYLTLVIDGYLRRPSSSSPLLSTTTDTDSNHNHNDNDNIEHAFTVIPVSLNRLIALYFPINILSNIKNQEAFASIVHCHAPDPDSPSTTADHKIDYTTWYKKNKQNNSTAAKTTTDNNTNNNNNSDDDKTVNIDSDADSVTIDAEYIYYRRATYAAMIHASQKYMNLRAMLELFAGDTALKPYKHIRVLMPRYMETNYQCIREDLQPAPWNGTLRLLFPLRSMSAAEDNDHLQFGNYNTTHRRIHLDDETYVQFEFQKQLRVLMLGLDGAGKTSLLYRLKLGETVTCIPTIGFNVETVVHRASSLTVWDVGGQDKIRPLWRHYYQSTTAIIWVIDSSNRARARATEYAMATMDQNEDIEELRRLVVEDALNDCPILVLCNTKNDEQAMSAQAVSEHLDLKTLLRNRVWHIEECYAHDARQIGVRAGLDWLVSVV